MQEVGLFVNLTGGAIRDAHSAVPLRSRAPPSAALGEGVCSFSCKKTNFLDGGGGRGLHEKTREGAIIA